jgi:hypothetical protein
MVVIDGPAGGALAAMLASMTVDRSIMQRIMFLS